MRRWGFFDEDDPDMVNSCCGHLYEVKEVEEKDPRDAEYANHEYEAAKDKRIRDEEQHHLAEMLGQIVQFYFDEQTLTLEEKTQRILIMCGSLGIKLRRG